MSLFVYEFFKLTSQVPNQVAVLDLENQVKLTYKELFSISQSLSSYLSCERSPICISVKPSWSLVAAILAVWISRNYLFILDPNSSKEKIKTILKLINPIFTLCDKDSLQTLPIKNKIFIDEFSFQHKVNFVPKSYSHFDEAYVVFTSGSTGFPKGILISHEGILDVLNYQKEQFNLSLKSKVLHYLNPSFDAFLSELGTTLLSGACFVIHSKIQKSLVLLENLVHEQKITHAFLPPAILGVLKPSEKLKSLQVIITGGEPTPTNVVRKWLPHVKLLSAYGPSETTICSHLAECTEDWDSYLGKLLPNRKEKLVYLEDENAHELWLGGKGLALKYISDSKKTFSKFIWSDAQRWYRTGDLVELTQKGLKFLRRRDKQVKLYGIRVELEEIENIAYKLPEVLFSHALYLNMVEQKFLVLVYHALKEIPKQTWIQHFKNHLLNSTIPNEIFYLETPILNNNGKWDHEKIKNLVIQKIFIYKSEIEDSLSSIQIELQTEKLRKIQNSPLFSLGAYVWELEEEIRSKF